MTDPTAMITLERIAAQAIAQSYGYSSMADVDGVDDGEGPGIRAAAHAVTKALLAAGAAITAPTDLNALAVALLDGIVHQAANVEARAQEIAQPRIDAAEADARERIAEIRGAYAVNKQRFVDLERELRRQLRSAIRVHAGTHREAADELRQVVVVWQAEKLLPAGLQGRIDQHERRAAGYLADLPEVISVIEDRGDSDALTP